jgi:hypothetical protein
MSQFFYDRPLMDTGDGTARAPPPEKERAVWPPFEVIRS